MRRIKVAEILEGTVGGTKTHLLQLAKHLDKNRFQVTLICSTRRDPAFMKEIARLHDEGVAVRIIPMEREIRPLSDAWALLRLWRRLCCGRYDVVHTHSSKAGFLGRLAARLACTPHVLHTPHVFPFQHDGLSERERRFYTGLERFAARLTDRLIVLSESQRGLVLRERICPTGKVKLIRNGVDLSEFPTGLDGAEARRALGLSADALVVGAVGRLVPQKGYPHLIAAAAKVVERFPKAVFMVAGGGELLDDLCRQASLAGVESHVRFIGEDSDIVRVYAAMDVFALPSLWEGMPYALLEAMAMAKPVVATNVSGLSEFVAHGKTGLLVAPGATDALAEAVERLLGDPRLRAQMGAAGRQRVEAEYGVGRMIAGLEALYAAPGRCWA